MSSKLNEGMESESGIIDQIFSTMQHQKRGEIFVKHFFRFWMQFSSVRGFFTDVQKANIIASNIRFVFDKQPLHIFFILLFSWFLKS